MQLCDSLYIQVYLIFVILLRQISQICTDCLVSGRFSHELPVRNIGTNIVMVEYGRHEMFIAGVPLLALVLVLMREGVIKPGQETLYVK